MWYDSAFTSWRIAMTGNSTCPNSLGHIELHHSGLVVRRTAALICTRLEWSIHVEDHWPATKSTSGELVVPRARAGTDPGLVESLAHSADDPPQPRPVSVEQLAERLRMMEEMNKKLADGTGEDQARASRADGADPQEIRGAVRNREAGAGRPRRRRAVKPAGGPQPSDDAPAADTDTPVPDYTEGQFGPYSPIPGHVPSEIVRREAAASAAHGQLRPRLPVHRPRTRNFAPGPLRVPDRGADLGAGRPGPGQQRHLPAPPANLLQRQHHQADRVRVLDQPGVRQPQPAERLHQHPLRRPVRAPPRPLLHAPALRPVRDLELLAADARAVALHDQRRAQPPVRADGMGLPLRQAARLRGGRLQRLAQLVREPQQRGGFRRLPEREAVPAVGVAAVRPGS